MRKIFEGKMLIRASPTTLLQIFYKIILNSQVVINYDIDTHDKFLRNLQGKNES